LHRTLVSYRLRGFGNIGTHLRDVGLSDFGCGEWADTPNDGFAKRTVSDDLLREARAADRAIAR
jgi:hypothetical protein